MNANLKIKVDQFFCYMAIVVFCSLFFLFCFIKKIWKTPSLQKKFFTFLFNKCFFFYFMLLLCLFKVCLFPNKNSYVSIYFDSITPIGVFLKPLDSTSKLFNTSHCIEAQLIDSSPNYLIDITPYVTGRILAGFILQ